MKQLLAHDATSIDITDPEGNTALMHAIDWTSYSQRIATLLSLAGADLNHHNNKGQTPLMIAGPNMQKTIRAAQEIRAIILAYVNALKSLLPHADDFESASQNNRTFDDFESAPQNNRTFADFASARLNNHTFFENPLPLDLARLILDYSLPTDDQIQNTQVSWFLQHLIKHDPELTKAQERAHASDDAHAVAIILDTPDEDDSSDWPSKAYASAVKNYKEMLSTIQQ